MVGGNIFYFNPFKFIEDDLGLKYGLCWRMSDVDLRELLLLFGSVLYMPVRFNWFMVLLKCSMFLLIFCLVVLSVILTEVLESLSIVGLSISPFNSDSFCSRYFGLYS